MFFFSPSFFIPFPFPIQSSVAKQKEKLKEEKTIKKYTGSGVLSPRKEMSGLIASMEGFLTTKSTILRASTPLGQVSLINSSRTFAGINLLILQQRKSRVSTAPA